MVEVANGRYLRGRHERAETQDGTMPLPLVPAGQNAPCTCVFCISIAGLTERQRRLWTRRNQALLGAHLHAQGYTNVRAANVDHHMRDLWHGTGFWATEDLTVDNATLFLLLMLEFCIGVGRLSPAMWDYQMQDAVQTLITHFQWPLLDPIYPASKRESAKRLINLLERNAEHDLAHTGMVYDNLRIVYHVMYEWLNFAVADVPLLNVASWPQPHDH